MNQLLFCTWISTCIFFCCCLNSFSGKGRCRKLGYIFYKKYSIFVFVSNLTILTYFKVMNQQLLCLLIRAKYLKTVVDNLEDLENLLLLSLNYPNFAALSKILTIAQKRILSMTTGESSFTFNINFFDNCVD